MIPFRTASGRRIDLEHPRPEDFVLEDVARGESHTCRFNGQLSRFYSVAQHSMLVASLVRQPVWRHALLHDASEAYLGDLARYLKHSTYLDGYREIEARVTAAIDTAFYLDEYQPEIKAQIKAEVKVADDLAACFEHELFQGDGWHGRESLEALCADDYVRSELPALLALMHKLPANYRAWSSFESYEQFMGRYTRYWEEIKSQLMGERVVR